MVRRRLSEASFGLWLNTPALVAILLLIGYPILYSLWISFHRYNLKRPNLFKFIWLENYWSILASDELWSALWITLLFTALAVAVVIALGVLIALLLNESFP